MAFPKKRTQRFRSTRRRKNREQERNTISVELLHKKTYPSHIFHLMMVALHCIEPAKFTLFKEFLFEFSADRMRWRRYHEHPADLPRPDSPLPSPVEHHKHTRTLPGFSGQACLDLVVVAPFGIVGRRAELHQFLPWVADVESFTKNSVAG
jgi:hypothetical protein